MAKKIIYKTFFKKFFIYGFIIAAITIQIVKVDVCRNFQNFIISNTIFIVKQIQHQIFKIEKMFVYFYEFDEINSYKKLQLENQELQSVIIQKDKEINKLSEVAKLVKAENIYKNLPYVICEISFYLKESRNIIICSIKNDKSSIVIKKNSLAVNDFGLVGRVLEDYNKDDEKIIKIQMITDSNFKIPIITSKSFVRGVAVGAGNKDQMNIFYGNLESLVNGEAVFTANNGNVVIKEIPIGFIAIDKYGQYNIDINNKINNLVYLKILI